MVTLNNASTDENVFLEWESPARPFQKRSKEFYKTATAIVFLVALILVFVGEFLLIGAIIATYFVIYVLSTVPPFNINHKITKLGIDTAEHFHKWEELRDFWFETRVGQRVLVIRTFLGFPSHLQILIGNLNESEVKKILVDRMPFVEKPPVSFLDQASAWLSQKIPLEKTTLK